MTTNFFEIGEESLAAAQACFDLGYYNSSVNRAYYAAFQAAIAALNTVGIRQTTYSHAWVQSTFSYELIHRRKIYPDRVKNYLPDMLLRRRDADYSSDKCSQKTAHRQLQKAKEFIDLIRKELTNDVKS